MPNYIDRVKETTTTTGTGTYDLDGAKSGFQGFVAGVGDNNDCFYAATDGTDWEVGRGTVSSGSPDTLSRNAVLASSNSGSAVNWGAGTKDIFLTLPAQEVLAGGSSADGEIQYNKNGIRKSLANVRIEETNNSDTLVIGTNANVQGQGHVLVGNSLETEDTSDRCVLIGLNHITEEENSLAIGNFARTRRISEIAQSSGSSTNTAGDAQTRVVHMYATTTDDTQQVVQLQIDGVDQLTIPNNSLYGIRAMIVGASADSDSEYVSTVDIALANDALTTTLKAANETVVHNSGGFGIDVQADDTTDALIIYVNGLANETVRWSARLEITEVHAAAPGGGSS